MVKSEQQRQRQLAKKKAKERQKHTALARQKQEINSLAGKMVLASRGRVLHCSVSPGIHALGIGGVNIFRESADGMVAMVVFLVDTCCLGVKDIASGVIAPATARERIQEMREQGSTDVSLGEARGLVERAVEYGRQNGFEPYPDYRKVMPIWGDTVAENIDDSYAFGRDGKPFFASGPYDDPARCQYIIATLQAKLGAGNFNYMVGGRDAGLSMILGQVMQTTTKNLSSE